MLRRIHILLYNKRFEVENCIKRNVQVELRFIEVNIKSKSLLPQSFDPLILQQQSTITLIGHRAQLSFFLRLIHFMLQTLAVQQFTNQKGALRIFLLFNFSLVLNYNDLREVPNEKNYFFWPFRRGRGGEPL